MCAWWLFIIIRQCNITKLLIKSDQAPSLNPKHEGWPYLTHCDNKNSSQALLGKMVRFMFKMLLNIWCDIIWIFFHSKQPFKFSVIFKRLKTTTRTLCADAVSHSHPSRHAWCWPHAALWHHKSQPSGGAVSLYLPWWPMELTQKLNCRSAARIHPCLQSWLTLTISRMVDVIHTLVFRLGCT